MHGKSLAVGRGRRVVVWFAVNCMLPANAGRVNPSIVVGTRRVPSVGQAFLPALSGRQECLPHDSGVWQTRMSAPRETLFLCFARLKSIQCVCSNEPLAGNYTSTFCGGASGLLRTRVFSFCGGSSESHGSSADGCAPTRRHGAVL